MNKGTYYFPRNRTYQPLTTSGGGGGGGGVASLPTYINIDMSASNYTMTGEGIYEIIASGGGTYNLIFPNISSPEGCLIVVINTTSDNIDVSSVSNQPVYSGTGGSGYVSALGKGTITQFISINGKWYTSN